MAKITKIPEPILAIISASTFDGNKLFLPPRQLPPKEYKAVASVIGEAGGIWNRKAQALVFSGDAAEAMEPILLTGEIVRGADLGQFDSPESVVARLIELAEIKPGMSVYEPSCGIGNIIHGLAKLQRSYDHDNSFEFFANELDQKRYVVTRERFFPAGGISNLDFLEIDAVPVMDRVVMNPPFAPRQCEIDHVLHASKFLKPGGRLVSVMSTGVLYRENRKTAEFREFVRSKAGYHEERLPEKSFASSGTAVNTCIIAFNV